MRKPIKKQKTKSIYPKLNGRSADITSANFVLGCYNKRGKAYCSYCYVARWDRKKIYHNTNKDQILNELQEWVDTQPWPKIPNQVHDTRYGVDIGCSVDVIESISKYDWFYVFDWFKDHPKLFPTFATKFCSKKLLDYKVESHLRIRQSLIPEEVKNVVETGTTAIKTRIKYIKWLQNAGWDVHLNFSPIIAYKGWVDDYRRLLDQIAESGADLDKIKCEVIFLTHNKAYHERNLENGLVEAEELLWKPEWQESKISQYPGTTNIRYKWKLKQAGVNKFKEIMKQHLPMVEIRYIF